MPLCPQNCVKKKNYLKNEMQIPLHIQIFYYLCGMNVVLDVGLNIVLNETF